MTKQHSPVEALCPDERAALERRLLARRRFGGTQEIIEPQQRDEPLPLSFAQQRLWFIQELESSATVYNVSWGLRILGPLDVPALHRAIDDVVARHESLRSTFPTVGRKPFVSIAEGTSQGLSVVETSADHEAQALKILEDEANTPFDLAMGPLFRLLLVRIGRGDHLLVFVAHHIVCDEWSLRNLHREIDEAYRARSLGTEPNFPTLPVQYADYALWQRQQLESGAYDGSLAYWRTTLDGVANNFTLPHDHAPQNHRRSDARNHRWLMPHDLAQATDELGREAGATPFMTTLAAFMALLHSWVGSEDIVISTPTAGRPRPELENLIGFIANTVTVRADAGGNPTFREFLARVRTCVLGGIANQDIPFDRVVEALKPGRNIDGVSIFNVLFSHRDSIAPALTDPKLRVSPVKPKRQQAKCDLWLSIVDEEDGRWATLVYDAHLYNESTIKRVATDLDELLRAIVSAPDTRLSDLRRNFFPAGRVSVESESTAPGTSGSQKGFVPPSSMEKTDIDDTSARLLDIWRRVLGQQDIGVTDNFFDLGGHSMLALELFAETDSQFGISLPLTLLFEAPTVSEFAKAIKQRRDSGQLIRVVAIQPHGQENPIFALPGGGGSVISYALLARSLGADQPFYGLEHPGLEGGETPPERIEAVAASFIEEILQLHPDRPCILLGACSGAVVAFELARLLACEGRRIDRVIMIDPPNIGARRSKPATSPAWRRMLVARFIVGRIISYVKGLCRLKGGARREFLKNKLGLFLEIIHRRDLFRDSARELNEIRVCEATVAALHNYSPQPYDGPVTLILGERFSPTPHGKDVSHWKAICSGPVEVFRIPGLTTGEMLKPPIVEDLVRHIRVILGRNA